MSNLIDKVADYIELRENRDKVILNIGKFIVIGGSIVTAILIYGISIK
jgi:hypothetical protein